MSDVSSSSHRLSWQTIDQQLLGRYKLFDLLRVHRRSPATGNTHHFLRLEAPDWVNVVAVDTTGRLILVEQYRHGTNSCTVEIPGGCVDPGEHPAGAGARELEEETGFGCSELIPLGVVQPNPAFLSNRCWTYLALDCTVKGDPRPDPSEEITVRRVGLDRFGALIDDGTITHSLVIAAHDHLQRGIRRGEPWASMLPGLQADSHGS